MGLDWIGYQQTDGEVGSTNPDDYIQDMYRGKGVAWDVNIEKHFPEIANMCYGSIKSLLPEMCSCDCIPPEEKKQIIDAIRSCIELPEGEIDFSDSNESREEWNEWMEGAISFLEENEYVFCWW